MNCSLMRSLDWCASEGYQPNNLCSNASRFSAPLHPSTHPEFSPSHCAFPNGAMSWELFSGLVGKRWRRWPSVIHWAFCASLFVGVAAAVSNSLCIVVVARLGRKGRGGWDELGLVSVDVVTLALSLLFGIDEIILNLNSYHIYCVYSWLHIASLEIAAAVNGNALASLLSMIWITVEKHWGLGDEKSGAPRRQRLRAFLRFVACEALALTLAASLTASRLPNHHHPIYHTDPRARHDFFCDLVAKHNSTLAYPSREAFHESLLGTDLNCWCKPRAPAGEAAFLFIYLTAYIAQSALALAYFARVYSAKKEAVIQLTRNSIKPEEKASLETFRGQSIGGVIVFEHIVATLNVVGLVSLMFETRVKDNGALEILMHLSAFLSFIMEVSCNPILFYKTNSDFRFELKKMLL